MVVNVLNDIEAGMNNHEIAAQVGDKYSKTVATGNYEVGVHLPTGRYAVDMKERDGAEFVIRNDTHGIRYQKSIDTDDGIANIQFQNVDLVVGDVIQIESTGGAVLVSKNAQTDSIIETNPNDEDDIFTMETNCTTGTDFSSGTYDVTLTSLNGNPGSMTKRYPYDGQKIYLKENETILYKNVEFSEGTSVIINNVSVSCTPSEFNNAQWR